MSLFKPKQSTKEAVCSICGGFGQKYEFSKELNKYHMIPCDCTKEVKPTGFMNVELPQSEVTATTYQPYVEVKQVKDKANKVPLHYIIKDMAGALLECAKVMQKGEEKYPKRAGWYDVPTDDIDAAITRHENAYFRGETKDVESGCHPLAHLAVDALMNLQKYLKDNNA